jgi:C4-dicarboxylate transporter, DctM subunit
MFLFGLFVAVIAIGIPIASAFGVAALLYMWLGDAPPINYDSLITVAFGGLDSFVLMSIPFFIFAGDLMKQGGIVRRLVDFSGLFVGKRGNSGIGTVAVTGSTFFGAISGSSAASVAAIGSVLLPEMEKKGYAKNRSAALIAASGYIGILIPPSIPLILYGLASSASIGDLFLAGILPGVLAALLFIGLNMYFVSRETAAPDFAVAAGSGPQRTRAKIFVDALPGLFLPVLILGGIYSGIFTPTEAAAVAVAYSLLVGLVIYRSIGLKDIPGIALESAVTSATIMVIIGFATFFGRLMTLEQIPAAISAGMLDLTTNPVALLLLINIFLLFLGMFIETATVIVIATPILLPLVAELGIDPVHFGIIMIVNLSIGLITPPMALNLFVISRVSGVPIKDLVLPVLPYVLASVVLLAIVVAFPELSTFLPNFLNR